MTAKRRANVREQRLLGWLALNIAALQRMRRLPKLDKLAGKEPAPKQSWHEQYQIALQWVAGAEKQVAAREKLNGR